MKLKISLFLLRGAYIRFENMIKVIETIISSNREIDRVYLAEINGFSIRGTLEDTTTFLKKSEIIYKKNYLLTEFGKIIYERDRYFENRRVLWLIHYIISSDKHNAGFFELFSNILNNENIINIDKIKEIYIEKYKENYSEKLLKEKVRAEIKAIIRLYLEENLVKLNLIEKDESNYKVNKEAFDEEECLLSIIYYFKEKYYGNSNVIEISALVNDDNSPGKICHISEYRMRILLEKLNKKGLIKIESIADLDQIRIIDEKKYYEVLKKIL